MTTRTKAQESLYEAVMPFSGTLDGVPVVFNPSAKLEADHPAVRAWSELFVRSDASTAEKQAAYKRVAGEPIIPDPAPVGRVLEQLSGPGVVKSTEDWQFGHELVMKGQRLRDSHELVRQYPECFESVES